MDNAERARVAFDKVAAASYFGQEFLYQLYRNHKALKALEELVKELENSHILSEAMKDAKY